jgi:hypothetical protein
MAFKLGDETRKYRTPKETPIYAKKLGKGILGEANNDGSIFVDKSLKPGSKKYNEVVKHEKAHIDDMESGELAYGNDWVRYKGKTYPRKGGKIKYDGKWKVEGHTSFPWEKAANKSPTKFNGKITTHKEERKIKRGWSDSRKAKHKETKKGMRELGIDKIERKYRDLRYPYQDDKKIKILRNNIAELEEKAIHAGQVNKNRIKNKIKKLKAKLPKRAR